LGNDSLESFILDRMIFHHDGQAPFLRVERWALRHSPALESAIELQTEIEMEPRRPMQLHHESQRPLAFPLTALRLGCMLKLTFYSILLKAHLLGLASPIVRQYYHVESCERARHLACGSYSGGAGAPAHAIWLEIYFLQFWTGPSSTGRKSL